MKYTSQRAEVIARQLKALSMKTAFSMDSWTVKEGRFFTPGEADAAPAQWSAFDSRRGHWYGPNAHYWFRGELTVPDELAGKGLWLNIRTQIDTHGDMRNPQFLVFVDGEIVQGADMFHREINLADAAVPGRKYVIDVQAFTGDLFGELRFLCDVIGFDAEVWGLYYDLQVPLWALERMDEGDKTRIDIESALNDTVNLIDMRDVSSVQFVDSVKAAREFVAQAVYTKLAGTDDVIASCIGHTHIDVAWLWTVEQTKEKTARSFSTVLKLMGEYPEYRFMSSQPQLYEFLKERYPRQYQRLLARVREGRWEPEGGMWVEADCNLTSGESLVRQFLYGKRFFMEEFGVDSKILWLPDVFGYSGALPQIMKKSGIEYFMTTKLSWNQWNRIPEDTLWWEGIDGSRIFTHFITTLRPGQDPKRDFFTTYNGMLHPDALMGGWERYQNKDINNDILIAYGFGDGGGGPTREMLETGRRLESGLKGVPKVRQTFAREYFDELKTRVENDGHMGEWVGEFYFEYHRGTYTSMARNKRGNRKSELALMDLELLSVIAGGKGIDYPQNELDALWKRVLLNQFHDILPGSSVKDVYDVTKTDYEWILGRCAELSAERMSAIAGGGEGIAVFNTLAGSRSGLVKLPEGAEGIAGAAVQDIGGERYAYVEGIPSKGFAVLGQSAGKSTSAPFEITEKDGGYAIKTPHYAAVFDKRCSFTSLFDIENDREVIQPGKAANLLRVFEDKPMKYDNWDIDIYYGEKHWDADGVTKMEWTSVGALAAELTVERAFMASKIIQKIRFYANSRRIDFDTWVDWRENQHLLRALFPVDIFADEATFDIQFGNVKRKTHTNTSWEKARFESCAHKWVDVSEAGGGYGVSLLNESKYGHSVRRGEIGITLIKSGDYPNPDADREQHSFTYSLLPHSGGWREADTQREAADLNQPMTAITGGVPGTRYSLADVAGDGVVLETIKRSEDGSGVILRAFESHGKRTRAAVSLGFMPQAVHECDLMENTVAAVDVVDGGFEFDIQPYEIKTFMLV